MSPRIPVTLLTGFLGSGKTTLLARLLRDPAMKDVAVIINEFGEVGLDHLLIEKGAEDVVLLDSGCLCCAVSNTLADTLADLHFRRLRGEIAAFTRVVIETSGLADPAPILYLVMADPSIAKWYVLDGIVATVDALHGDAQLDAHDEARKQAAMADLLVLTKVDVSPREVADRLDARLAHLNPGAARLGAVRGEVPAQRILGLGPYDPAAKSADVAQWLAAEQHHSHGHSGHAHRHDDDIATHTVILGDALQWSDYAEWLARLRRLPAERLLRVKGVIALGEAGAPHVVQGVQHVFGHPAPLAAWPWPDRTSRLVFIVRGIATHALLEALGGRGVIADAARPAPH